MAEINNADLSNLNNPVENPVDYSQVGKEVKTNLPANTYGDFEILDTKKQLPPSIDLKDYQRYTASDAFPKIGIDPNLSQEQIERQYDANQSYGEAFGNTMGKLWNTTANSFTDFFRADFTTNDALMKHVYNSLQEEKQYDLFHPNFDSRDDETKKSFLQWVPGFNGSLDNYEQFLPNLGYTIGMGAAGITQNLLTSVVLGGLGEVGGIAQSSKKGRDLYNLITGFNNFETGLTALKTITKGNPIIKGMQVGLEGYTLWSAFQSEAATEGAHTGQETYNYLVDSYVNKNGMLPVGEELDKIKKSSYDAAKADYWMNAPILLTSNLIQFSRALMPTGTKLFSELTEDAFKGYTIEGDIAKGTAFAAAEKPFAQIWKEGSTLGRVKMASKLIASSLEPMRDMLTEGMEESLQRFSSSLSQDYFITKNQKGKGDLWDSTKYSFLDMISKEGLQEFIGGAVIGMGTSMVGKISDISGLSDKFAKFTGGETEIQKQQRLALYREGVIGMVNNSSINFMLKDQGFKDAFREALLAKDVIEFNEKKDWFSASSAKHLGLINGVINAVNSGKDKFITERYDSFGNTADMEYLANKLNVSVEDINADNLRQITNSISDKIKEVKNNYETVKDHVESLGTEKRILQKYNKDLKDAKEFEQMLRAKYDVAPDVRDLTSIMDKVTPEEDAQYKEKLGRIQDNQVIYSAFKEGVKTAAVAYQVTLDSAKKINTLVGELNDNKAGLNYSEGLAMMNRNALIDLKKRVETSLSLANEPQDKRKYQRQLDILNEALEEHYFINEKGNRERKHDSLLNVEKLADLMHRYALANKYEYDALNDYLKIGMFEKTSNYKQKLEDAIKHQLRSKDNLDIYNFLYSADNFEKYMQHSANKIYDFFEKVVMWNISLMNQQNEEEIRETPEAPREEGKEEEVIPNKPGETPGSEETTVMSDEIQKEIEKNEGKNSPYNIEILVDENGKHRVKATYANSIYGKGEVAGDEKNAIDAKYADLIKRLDEEEIEKRKRKEVSAELKTIGQEYQTKLEELGEEPTKEDLEELLKDFDNKISNYLPKYSKNTSIVETRKNILDKLINVSEDYYVDGQRDNSYVPDDELERRDIERNEFFEPSPGAVAYVSSIKTSSQDEVLDMNTGLGRLKDEDSYAMFERDFRLHIPNIEYLFYSEKNPNGIYRFVMTPYTEELQLETREKILPDGTVLLLQIKDGNEWKKAYVNQSNLEISNDSSEGKPMVIYFNNPEGTVFKKEEAARLQEKYSIRPFEEALIFFAEEDKENRRLRIVSSTKEIPVQIEMFSPGVVMNFSDVTAPARQALKDNITDRLSIAISPKITDGSKTPPVIFGNREFLAGSAVLQTRDGDYVKLYPGKIPQDILDHIDTLMEHKYRYEVGQPMSNEIKNIIKHISTFVYTNKKTIRFRFDPKTRTIKLIDEKSKIIYNKISDYNKKNELKLNVSSSQLRNPSWYTIKKTTEDGKEKVAIKGESYTPEEYIKFIIDNSEVRGSFDDAGKPIYVSSYFTFSEIIGDKINPNAVPLELIQLDKDLSKKINDLILELGRNREYVDAYTKANEKQITSSERDVIVKRLYDEIGLTSVVNELREVKEKIALYEAGLMKDAKKLEQVKKYEISDNDWANLTELNSVLDSYGLSDKFSFITPFLTKNKIKVSFDASHRNGKMPKIASIDTAIVGNKLSIILTINKSTFDKLNYDQKLEAISHEFVHALIKLKLNESNRLEDEAFYKGLNDIFSDVSILLNSIDKKDLEFLNANFTLEEISRLKQYKNKIEDKIEEFATLGLTNPLFSKLLKLMKGTSKRNEKTSLWTMLVDLISKFTGVQKSKFNDLLNYLSDNLNTYGTYFDQSSEEIDTKKADIEKRRQEAESKITPIDIDVVDKSGNKTGEVRIKEYSTIYGKKRLAAKTEEELKKLIEVEYNAELAALEGTEVKQTTPTLLNKITELNNKLNDLYDKKEQLTYEIESYKDSPSLEQIIAENLPAISKESAEKETGGQVGKGKDINPTLIAKKTDEQMSVEAAAESVLEQVSEYYGDRYDVQDVRSAIIDILKSGKTKKQFLKELDRTKDLKNVQAQIKEIEKQLEALEKNKSKELTSSIEEIVETSTEEDNLFNKLFDLYVSNPANIYDFTEYEKEVWNKPKYEERRKDADIRRNDENSFDEFDSPFRSKEEEDFLIDSIVEEMGDEEINFITKLNDRAELETIFRAANSKYWGKFTTAGVILTTGAKKGTGYHESWHVFSQMFLTKEQKDKLYKETISKESKFKDYDLKNLKQLLEIEEFLANDFMNYMLTGESELLNKTPVKKGIFKKILDFLMSLFFKDINLEKAYNDLRVGNLYEYKASSNNAIFGKLNYAKGLENLSYDRLIIYSRHADAEIGRIVSQPLTNVTDEKYKGKILTQSRAISSILDNPELTKIVKEELYARMNNLGKNAANPLVKEEVAYILNNWESFLKYNSEYSTNSYDLTDDIEYKEGEESEESTKERVFDARPDEEKPSYIGKKITKQLLLLCPKCIWNNEKNTYSLVIDENGIIEPANFETLWTNIIVELSDTFNEDQLFEKMKNKDAQRRVPEMGYIVDNLIPQADFKNKGKTDLRHSFFLSFSNPIVHVNQLIRTEKRIPTENPDETILVYDYILRKQTKNNQKAIEKRALSKFQGYSKESSDPFIVGMAEIEVIQRIDNKNIIGENYKNVFPRLNFGKINDCISFLKLLGYEIPEILPNEKIKLNEFNSLKETIKTLATNLYQRVLNGLVVDSPINDLKKETKYFDQFKNDIVKVPGERDAVRKITEFISKYSLQDSSMSYNAPNGKLRYAPVKPNKITTTNHFLSRTSSYEELINPDKTYGFNFEHFDIDKYANARGSYFLSLMFGKTIDDNKESHERKLDRNNEPVRIVIDSYVGYGKQNEQGATVESYDSDELSDRDKLVAYVNSLITSGTIPMLRAASKRTELSMVMSTYNPYVERASYLPIPLEKIRDIKNPYAIVDFVNIVNNYLESELFKIGNPNYQKVGRDKFSLFSDIFNKKEQTLANGKTLEENLIKEAKEVKDGNYMNVIQKYNNEIQAAMLNYFTDRKNELKKELDTYKIGENEMSYTVRKVLGLSMDKILDAVIINNYILKVEEIKLFRNDPSLYKDMFKRIGQDVSTGTLAIPSEGITNYLYQTRFFNFSTGVSKNPISIDSLSKLNFVTAADQIEKNSPIISPVSLGNKLNFLGNKEPVAKIVSDAAYSYGILKRLVTGETVNSSNPEFIRQIEEEFIPVDDKGKVGGYGNINVTDGGAKITLDAYRRIRMTTQNWEDKHEYLYRALSLSYKLKKELYKHEVDPEGTKRKWTNDMESYFDLSEDAVFNIAKFQFNVTIVKDGVEYAILHKLSLSPIIPEAIETKDLEVIHEDMLVKGIDYLPFESASKVSTINIINLFEAGLNKTNIDPNLKIEIDISSAKEQINVENKLKKDVSAGVQMQQLNFQDLMVDGKPVDFPGTAEEYEATPDEHLSTIGLSHRLFNRSMNTLRNLLRKELLEELNIVDNGNGKYSIRDAKKLVEKLHNLANGKNASINVLDYVAYDEVTKGLANPLDFSMTSDDIKKMINGLLDRKLRKMRLYGSSSIQDSDFGQGMRNHSFTNPTQEQLLEYGTNGLPFYYLKEGKDGIIVSKMGIAMTFTGDYVNLLNAKHLDGAKVDTLKRLNECLRDKKWRELHEDALTIVGYRTPTQGKNAMDIMIIHEFLPEYMGNTIILPAGITTKSGTDYDIDKMSLYFKHLDYNGNVISDPGSLNKIELRKRLAELEVYLELNYSILQEAKKDKKEILNSIKSKKEKIDTLLSFDTINSEGDESDQEANESASKEKLREKEAIQKEVKSLYRKLRRSADRKIIDFYSKLTEAKAVRKILDERVQAQNQMVKSIELALSSPITFYSLTKPNSSSQLEEISKEIGSRTGRETKIFKNSEVLNLLSSWQVSNQLNEAKAGLSGWAANITFSQNLISSGLSLTNTFRVTDNGKQIFVNNPLITRDQESKVMPTEHTYKLSNLFMLDGKTLMSSAFIEASTMTVDVENNPFARTLGLNNWNNWISIYMTHKQIPFSVQWAFLNQPILLELYKRLNYEGFINKNTVIAQMFNEYFSKFFSNKKVLANAAFSKQSAKSFITYLQMIKVKKFDKNQLMDSLSPDSYDAIKNRPEFLQNKRYLFEDQQFNALLYFVQMDQESKLLQKLRKNTNFPSRKITSLQEVKSIRITKGFLKRSPFFLNISDYYKRAVSLKYDELNIFETVYSTLFPISSDNIISELFLKNENRYTDESEDNKFAPQKNVWTDAQKQKAERILTNDIIFGIIQNFGYSYGEIGSDISLGNYMLSPGDSVLINKKGKKGLYIITKVNDDGYVLQSDKEEITAKYNEVIALETFKLADDVKGRLRGGKKGRPIINDILKLKDKYPGLEKEFSILNRFTANIDNANKTFINVELFRQDANQKADKDSYIIQLKKLANHNNFEIAGVFSELMLVAFYQAGYNMSPLYFTDLLDIDTTLSRMIHNANNMFLRLKEEAPDFLENFLYELAGKVRLNNPNYYYYHYDRETGNLMEPVNFKYHRGKDYSIDANQIGINTIKDRSTLGNAPNAKAGSNVVTFSEEHTNMILNGEKTLALFKKFYKDIYYRLNNTDSEVKLMQLGDVMFGKDGDDEYLYIEGKIPASSKLINTYSGEESNISLIDKESFAKELGFKNFEEAKEKSIFVKGLVEGTENLKMYEITSVKKVKTEQLINPSQEEFNKLPSPPKAPTMTYAGIGSRETPGYILTQMTEVAKELDSLGFVLQTGFTFKDKKTGIDEEGADKAFSDGSQNKILFGPSELRETVNGKVMTRNYGKEILKISEAVMNEIHPAPERLSAGAKKLMSRNTNQVFGENLNRPVDFVIFYAPETVNPLRPSGGTGQAVEMARRKGIPTINMDSPDWKKTLQEVVLKIRNFQYTKPSIEEEITEDDNQGIQGGEQTSGPSNLDTTSHSEGIQGSLFPDQSGSLEDSGNNFKC